MSKPELIKVVHEEASNIRIDPKVLASEKGGQEFKKIQDAELKVLNREHLQKVKKVMKLRNKRFDQYMWITTSRLKLKPITDVKIHANTKPTVITVYRGTDRRNFKVQNPFKFGDFRITKLDKLVLSLRRKRTRLKIKHMELEPEIRIPGLECSRGLPEGVSFVNNMVIEEPEYGLFFIDVFGDEAF
ncbi:hypothetical protein Tco_0500978 [Tanacetum coccineum]